MKRKKNSNSGYSYLPNYKRAISAKFSGLRLHRRRPRTVLTLDDPQLRTETRMSRNRGVLRLLTHQPSTLAGIVCVFILYQEPDSRVSHSARSISDSNNRRFALWVVESQLDMPVFRLLDTYLGLTGVLKLSIKYRALV